MNDKLEMFVERAFNEGQLNRRPCNHCQEEAEYCSGALVLARQEVFDAWPCQCYNTYAGYFENSKDVDEIDCDKIVYASSVAFGFDYRIVKNIILLWNKFKGLSRVHAIPLCDSVHKVLQFERESHKKIL